ncbi:hypothetical protein PybrP1_007798 [[Pythium] brassicae (nom. inval.)]|nr:hypothetical protein PybrP1_007798 [[Pythium] brassicae (nom. inval.)]
MGLDSIGSGLKNLWRIRRRRTACWLGGLRALIGWLKLVEDDGFRNYVEYVAQLGGIRLKNFKRGHGRSDDVRTGVNGKGLKNSIQRKCEQYALMTDIWTNRAQRSFMAITIHYLNPQFELKKLTLEVEPFYSTL